MRLFLYMFFSALISALFFLSTAYLASSTYRFNCYTSLRSSLDERVGYEKEELTRDLEAVYRIAVLSTADSLQQNLQPYYDAASGSYDKIFIIDRNGNIISHSNLAEKIRLNNTINTDTAVYNRTLLVHPLTSQTQNMRIVPYHIIANRLPFTESTVSLIEEHLFRDIRANAVLAQRIISLSDGNEYAINIIAGRSQIHGLIAHGFRDLENQLLYLYLIFSLGGTLTWILLILLFIKIGSHSSTDITATKAYLPQELIYENRDPRQIAPAEKTRIGIDSPGLEEDIDIFLNEEPVQTIQKQSKPAVPENTQKKDTITDSIAKEDMDSNFSKENQIKNSTNDMSLRNADVFSEENDIFLYEETDKPQVPYRDNYQGLEIVEHAPANAQIIIQDAIPVRKSSRGNS